MNPFFDHPILGNPRAVESITDQDLLREVMNTVGKPDQLGGSIRCVVSVSMLTEVKNHFDAMITKQARA